MALCLCSGLHFVLTNSKNMCQNKTGVVDQQDSIQWSNRREKGSASHWQDDKAIVASNSTYFWQYIYRWQIVGTKSQILWKDFVNPAVLLDTELGRSQQISSQVLKEAFVAWIKSGSVFYGHHGDHPSTRRGFISPKKRNKLTTFSILTVKHNTAHTNPERRGRWSSKWRCSVWTELSESKVSKMWMTQSQYGIRKQFLNKWKSSLLVVCVKEGRSFHSKGKYLGTKPTTVLFWTDQRLEHETEPLDKRKEGGKCWVCALAVNNLNVSCQLSTLFR